MTSWNPSRPLSSFPSLWHAIVGCRLGQFIAATGTRSQLAKDQRRWQCFMAACREQPSHPTAKLAAQSTFRSRIKLVEGHLVLTITVRPKAFAPAPETGAEGVDSLPASR